MSRRRYLSTDISTDERVALLAERSPWAALLYTWMIPHAADDGSIRATAMELRAKVGPLLPLSNDEVRSALGAMHDLELVTWDREANVVAFPDGSFYRHQSYIKDERRKSAQNAANQRTSSQNAASFKSSFSSSDSDSATPPLNPPAAEPAALPIPASPVGADAPKGERPVKKSSQPSEDGYAFVGWWCEATRTAIKDDQRRRAALVADALLAKCAGAAASLGILPFQEAREYLEWRILRGYHHTITVAHQEYVGTWRGSAQRARASPDRNGHASEGIVNEMHNRSVYERRVLS